MDVGSAVTRAGVGAAIVVVAVSIGTGAQGQAVIIGLPAGPVGRQVARLGALARVSIAVREPALRSRSVPALRGRISVEVALRRIARNADARLMKPGPGTYDTLLHAWDHGRGSTTTSSYSYAGADERSRHHVGTWFS